MLPERVLVVVVDGEVRGQSVVHKRVVVLEYHLDRILCLFLEICPRNRNFVRRVLHLPWFQLAPVDLHELDVGAVVGQREEVVLREAVEREGQVDHALVAVALHHAQDHPVLYVPYVLQLCDQPRGQVGAVEVLDGLAG